MCDSFVIKGTQTIKRRPSYHNEWYCGPDRGCERKPQVVDPCVYGYNSYTSPLTIAYIEELLS